RDQRVRRIARGRGKTGQRGVGRRVVFSRLESRDAGDRHWRGGGGGGGQAPIAAPSRPPPPNVIIFFGVWAPARKRLSVLHLLRGRVRKWVAPIQALRVPNGCSTVWRRTPMASGMRSSWSCILSSTSSCSQRLMIRRGVGVHRDRSGQVVQALRWR